MANPAELLVQQLSDWNGTHHETAQSRRKVAQSNVSKGGWADHRRAARLLLEVEDALRMAAQQGHSVDVYLEYLDAWTRSIWVFPDGWSAQGKHSVFKNSLDQLRGASSVLDMVIPTFESAEKAHAFSGFLSVLLAKIDGLGDEHRHLKDHASRIVRHLIGCIDDVEILGEFQIYDALQDLQRILDVLSEAVPSEPFFDRAGAGMWFFFRKTAVVLASGLAVGAINAAGEEVYEVVKSEIAAITSSDQGAPQPPGQSQDSDTPDR